MTLQEAYLKAKSDGEEYGPVRLSSCRDYGEFWGFCFVPALGKNLLKELNGGIGECDITVNKKTGAIGYFIPPMDFDLWNKAVPVPIEQFSEYNVAI